MLRDGSNDVNEAVWVGDGKPRSWQQIDRALRVLARRRCGLDIEEAELLRAAVRIGVWRELGKASLHEYLEDVLGYSPRMARERVRVALALVELPDVAEAFACGELHWSAVRELTRIVTAITQAEWLADVRGNNLRQIEEKVACRRRGDRPSDPPKPELKRQVARFEQLTPSTMALLRQVQQVLADERGERLDDDELLAAMCNAVLGGGGDETGRAKYQIMTVVCEACERGFQDAGGRRIAIEKSAVERAQCDAQRIGSATTPQRATQDVSPSVRRLVHRRDAGKCCVPSCRASRFLDVHHVVPRAAGGDHEPENLTLLCDGHHAALHDGKLTITGKAPNLDVRWTRSSEPPEPHVGREGLVGKPDTAPARDNAEQSKFAFVALKTEVKRGLVQQGFKRHEASEAVEGGGDPRGSGRNAGAVALRIATPLSSTVFVMRWRDAEALASANATRGSEVDARAQDIEVRANARVRENSPEHLERRRRDNSLAASTHVGPTLDLDALRTELVVAATANPVGDREHVRTRLGGARRPRRCDAH